MYRQRGELIIASFIHLLLVKVIEGLVVVRLDAPDEVWCPVNHLLQEVHEGVSEVGGHRLLSLRLGRQAPAVVLRLETRMES